LGHFAFAISVHYRMDGRWSRDRMPTRVGNACVRLEGAVRAPDV
jgi:hypothetical protein